MSTTAGPDDADRRLTPVAKDILDRLSVDRDLAVEKIRLSDSLLDDLGMDGDDAVAFFEVLDKEYGPAFDPMYRHWSRHFGPEGFGDIWLLLVLLSVLPALWLASLGRPWSTAGAATLMLLTLGTACWKWIEAWRGRLPRIAITVAQLIEAAETGRWPIVYPSAAP